MSLCSACDSLDLETRSSRLGTYEELVSRSKICEACLFFINVLHSSTYYADDLSRLADQVVFFESKRLSVKQPEKLDRMRWSCDDLLFDVCVGEEYDGPSDPEIDKKRMIPKDPSDEKCTAQVKDWLSVCTHHSDCSSNTNVPLPERIIHIPSNPEDDPQVIISNGLKGSYAVLSFHSDPPQTPEPPTIINTQEALPQTLNTANLPITFADAITTARNLGFSYLWIRDICLAPNTSTLDSETLIPIFANSTLLLSATTATSPSSGFLHPRQNLYSPALGATKSHYLRLHLLRWKWDLEHAPLSRNGAAALERILAPRVLHFTKRQLMWECASAWHFEASSIPDLLYGSGQVRMTYRKGFVQPYVTKYLKNHKIAIEEPSEPPGNTTHRLEAWHQCLDHLLSLPYPNHPSANKPALLTPLITILSHPSLGRPIAGLWSNHLTTGLSWSRANALLTPTPSYIAPTWSPLSVTGTSSSLFLDWPASLAASHAEDPSWKHRYGMVLLSSHVEPVDPLKSSGVVKEGSYIKINASCLPLQTLIAALQPKPNNNDEYNNDTTTTTAQDLFMLNPGLDSSPVFDCHCCMPLPADEQHLAETAYQKTANHHICVILESDAFRQLEGVAEWKTGFVDMLILQLQLQQREESEDQDGGEGGSDGGDGEVYRRVGFARLGKAGGYFETQPDYVAEFDKLGWERRDLRLV